ncbi:MAG: hypothetical protein WD049_08235 [Candidatus Paceibacterota bacterium]
MSDQLKQIGVIAMSMVVILLPFVAGAHGGSAEGDQTSSYMMMHMEEEALGSERHEEMEALMEKMFAGELTEEEALALEKLSRDHSGAFSIMASRMHNHSGFGQMMPAGWMFSSMSGWVGILMVLGFLVWLGVGVLLIAVLIQKVTGANHE